MFSPILPTYFVLLCVCVCMCAFVYVPVCCWYGAVLQVGEVGCKGVAHTQTREAGVEDFKDTEVCRGN